MIFTLIFLALAVILLSIAVAYLAHTMRKIRRWLYNLEQRVGDKFKRIDDMNDRMIPVNKLIDPRIEVIKELMRNKE